MDGHCVLSDDFPHLLDLVFEISDVLCVLLDGTFRFIILLLEDIFLGCDSLKFFSEGFGSSLQLEALCYQFFELQFIL